MSYEREQEKQTEFKLESSMRLMMTRKWKSMNKRRTGCAGLFGILFSMAMVWGYQLEKNDNVDFTSLTALLAFMLLAFAAAIMTNYAWKYMEAAKEGHTPDADLIKSDPKNWITDKSFFIMVWAGLVLCQIPVLLAEYPGFFVYDAQTELMEVVTRQFTTHHPLLHVLALGGTICAVRKLTGSWNAGIFSYIFLQMLIMTAIFAYVLTYLRKRRASRKFLTASFLFYGIFPTIVMYTNCSTKDGLFSAFLLLTFVLLHQLYIDTAAFCDSKRKQLLLVISASLMMLLRHNGLYSYIVFVPFALIIMFRKMRKSDECNRKGLITVLLILIIPVMISLSADKVMEEALCVGGTDNQELLTVPIQQLARTYKYSPDSFSDTEKECLFRYLPEEAMALYTPRCSDLIKSKFNNKSYEKDRQSFYTLWLKKGLENPATYVNAWFMTSYGYWYPKAVINVYQGNSVFTFTYKDSSYFGYEVEAPGERHSFIPSIDKFYRKLSIEKFQQEIPLISLLFAPAFYFWLLAFVTFYRISVRKTDYLMPLLIIFLTWLTVLLGPTYLVRYVIILWYVTPLIVAKETES